MCTVSASSFAVVCKKCDFFVNQLIILPLPNSYINFREWSCFVPNVTQLNSIIIPDLVEAYLHHWALCSCKFRYCVVAGINNLQWWNVNFAAGTLLHPWGLITQGWTWGCNLRFYFQCISLNANYHRWALHQNLQCGLYFILLEDDYVLLPTCLDPRAIIGCNLINIPSWVVTTIDMNFLVVRRITFSLLWSLYTYKEWINII